MSLSIPAFVLWTTNPELWHTIQPAEGILERAGQISWYGLLFSGAFVLGQMLMGRIFKAEGKPAEDVDTLTFMMILGTVLGARLGHCLFYEPAYFLSHPLEILMVWKGGLASHGATIGILTAVWLYSRKRAGQSYLWTLDRIVILVALGGAMIRTGNLINQEIIGKPTDAPWGFVFSSHGRWMVEQSLSDEIKAADVKSLGQDSTLNNLAVTKVAYSFVFDGAKTSEAAVKYRMATDVPKLLLHSNYDEPHLIVPQQKNITVTQEGNDWRGTIEMWGIPRHPSQIYEALSCLLVFAAFLWQWNRKQKQLPEGQLFGMFLIVVFGLRIFYELLKENQVAFEDGLSLNMGQILSIPLVLAGLYLTLVAKPGKQNTAE